MAGLHGSLQNSDGEHSEICALSCLQRRSLTAYRARRLLDVDGPQQTFSIAAVLISTQK